LRIKIENKEDLLIESKKLINSGAYAEIYSTNLSSYVIKVMNLESKESQLAFENEKQILELK
jgi:hypothetical protein